MNEERNRLQTFTQWPTDAPVSSQKIAKAGFYSTGLGLEVECYACHLKIDSWEYSDQVMTRHRFLSPLCPFVLQNPTTSFNEMYQLVPSSSVLDYQDESIRLSSFDGWPISHIVSPESLARAGFYYLKEGDHTKCAFCKGVVRAWELGDNPDIEHKKHFPTCSFVITTISPRLNTNQAVVNIQNKVPFPNINILGTAVDGRLDELGVQKHNGPKRPDYATVESRLRSFVAWLPALVQTPEILANAGFYYEGMGDQVRCFHCDGGLRHWDPEDDPWTEHARWFPRCSFVLLVKGQEFVAACALDATAREQQSSQLNDKIKPIRRRREVSDRELQEHMISGAALAALGIGINVERVKRAIKEKLETTGKGYSEPDALVEAALNMQLLDEDDNFDTETPHSCALSSMLNDITKTFEPQENLNRDNLGTQVNENDSQCSVHNVDSSRSTKSQSVSLEEENRQLKEARQCKICMDNEVGIVFLPCGHLTTCTNCAPNLEDCPVCRCAIKATVRTFLS